MPPKTRSQRGMDIPAARQNRSARAFNEETSASEGELALNQERQPNDLNVSRIANASIIDYDIDMDISDFDPLSRLNQSLNLNLNLNDSAPATAVGGTGLTRSVNTNKKVRVTAAKAKKSNVRK